VPRLPGQILRDAQLLDAQSSTASPRLITCYADGPSGTVFSPHYKARGETIFRLAGNGATALVIRGRRLRLSLPILGGEFLCGHLGA
jgi:hypothetical protein